MVISGIGFSRCHTEHSVFVRHTKSGSAILAVHVDDILLTESDSVTLAETKESQTIFCDERYGKPRFSLALKLLIKSMVYFYLRGSIHLISLRKLAYWGANLLALQ